MAEQGEVVLRQRFCLGSECHAVFFVCSHCDRGQRHCSLACRKQARLRQHRGANRRYRNSPEARKDHRDRQREYRRLRAQTRVPDHKFHFARFPAIIRMWEGRSNRNRSSTAILYRGAPCLARKTVRRMAVLPGLWSNRAFGHPFPHIPKPDEFLDDHPSPEEP